MNEEIRTNPFFEDYQTLHDTVPFDRIRLEDFEEAFMEGIRRDNEMIDKTINNPAKPTFDNTIIYTEEDKEGYYDLLDRVSTVFFNLLSAETNDEMDALAQKMQPILTQHANDMRLNKQLFERIKAVHLHHRKLTPEEKMLLDNCYDGFVRSGSLLDEEGKERLRALTEEASMLSLQFSQNLLKETKAFTLHITNEKQLDGLPDTAIEAARQAAKEKELDGWLFTLDSPSYGPFMTYSTQRELREKMFLAKNTLCTHDNTENNLAICQRIVNLRREIAQLLGYKTYADYVLKKRMASNVRSVYRLLDDLIDAYKPTAIEEYHELEMMAREKEGKDFKMMPWDQSFYAHKLQLKKFKLD
ncbi:MAG: peptidase M3, partial [Prevotella sp.]|nr:peptidase M3 [Prevotella sp.]